jgi:ethanolamine ammonia-lyase large subunit
MREWQILILFSSCGFGPIRQSLNALRRLIDGDLVRQSISGESKDV